VFLLADDVSFLLGYSTSAPTVLFQGTASEPIVFRSASGNSGWYGSVQTTNATNLGTTFEYVQFLRGGGNNQGALNLGAALPAENIKNCSFVDYEAYGIPGPAPRRESFWDECCDRPRHRSRHVVQGKGNMSKSIQRIVVGVFAFALRSRSY
jgi:hypothetical protein